MTTSRHRRRKWALLLGMVVVFALVGVYLLTFRTGSKLLSSPPPPQNYRLAFLGKYMWPVRRQLLRLKQTFFGPPRTVQVDAIISELDSNGILPPPILIQALTNTQGDRMWVADELTLREIVTNMTYAVVGSRPNITMSEGMQGQMAAVNYRPTGAGSNAPHLEVGFWLNVWPRVRSDRIDLTCFYTQNELVWRRVDLPDGTILSEPLLITNVAFGAQANIPIGASVLLLSGATNSRGRITAALITPFRVPKK